MIRACISLCVLMAGAQYIVAQPTKKYDIDIFKRIEECEELVKKAVSFFEINTIDNVCRAFLNDPKWWHGELVPFIFNQAGVCYVFGKDRSVIWKSFDPEKTRVREDFLKNMFETGRRGGFVNFTWNNGYMHASVRSVFKNGQGFIIGVGFYPDSARYITEQLVRNVIEFAADHKITEVFEAVNNPLGRFIHGDGYISMFRFDGVCVAHGRGLQLIGQNLINDMTADGKYRTRDAIEIAKNPPHHGWYRYTSKSGGVPRDMYISRLVGSDGVEYVVLSGYNPTLTERDVRASVKRAVSYIQTHGTKQAFPVISQPTGPLAYGGITVFVYNMEGETKADMANPSFVGQNLSQSVDADGKFVTKSIIEEAQRFGSGWLSFSLYNSFAMIYVEKLSLQEGDFVVGASYFPNGKEVTVQFMVEKAARHLEVTKPSEEVFADFSSGSSDYLRGNVGITVFKINNGKASILVSGNDRDIIWDPGLSFRDTKGRQVMKKIISIGQSGGGWIVIDIMGRPYRLFLRPVSLKRTIDGGQEIVDEYIVASGYFF